MQALCKSEYQDLFRVKDGVLLVVNKFKYIPTADYIGNAARRRRYTNNCQKELEILTKDYIDKFSKKTYQSGQVIYNGYPVEIVDKDNWNYQIKTTGTNFSGNWSDVITFLSDISYIIRRYYP